MRKQKALDARKDKLSVLPRGKVSEYTRSPFVVWSKKYKLIVSEHWSKASAVSFLRRLRKEIKSGVYDT